MGNIVTTGPDEVLIVSGGCWGADSKKTVIGGWAWAWWLVSDVKKLSLNVMTIKPKCASVETAQGVPLHVTGIAQVKVMTAKDFLPLAAEQFVGMSQTQIHHVLQETLEGHLRAILGTLSIEDIYRDREKFASLVREMATPDLGRMGMEIVSFTIKEVYDSVEYLSSLGKTRTAEVRRDAQIGVAVAERDSGIKEAECEKSSMDIKFQCRSKIEDNNRQFLLKKAAFDAEVNAGKAEAELAYELQQAKTQQAIRNEEMQIEVVERRKLIQVQEKEIERKEKELTVGVRLPAEAEAYKVEMLAQGQKIKTVATAQAEAQRIKLKGQAQAEAIEAIGKAEAEKMRKKAEAFKQYEEAAVLSLTLEALPKVAAEVARPLARTDNIVILGSDGKANFSDSLTRTIAELPQAVKAVSGVDLSGILAKIPGATMGNSSPPQGSTQIKTKV